VVSGGKEEVERPPERGDNRLWPKVAGKKVGLLRIKHTQTGECRGRCWRGGGDTGNVKPNLFENDCALLYWVRLVPAEGALLSYGKERKPFSGEEGPISN